MKKDLSMTKVLATPVGSYTLKHHLANALLKAWEDDEQKTNIIHLIANSTETLSMDEYDHYDRLVKAAIRYLCL